MRFLVDVDGVVAGCMTLMIKEINERFRTHYHQSGFVWRKPQLRHGDITKFDFFNPKHGILTPGECKFAVENFSRDEFAYDMPPIPEAVPGVQAIRDAGHEVVFVTAQWGSSVDWCHSRVRWLEQHFNANRKDIVFVHRKELVVGDILIEDRDKTCETYAVTHPNSRVLLMNQPWNAEHTIVAPNIQRFEWQQISSFMREL